MNYEQIFTEHGVRLTATRQLVYDALYNARHPMGLRELEDILLTVDRSTIFRALTLFQDHHMVHAILDGAGNTRYELCHSRHHHTDDDLHPHFYCECCHRTICLHHYSIPQLQMPGGFTVHSINYMIHGLCPECASRAERKKH